MRKRFSLGLVGLTLTWSCHPSAPNRTAADEPLETKPGAERRMRMVGSDRVIINFGELPRGTFLKVLSPRPIAGTTTHNPIGIAQVVEPWGKVEWYCEPKDGDGREALDGILKTEGVPVELFKPDTVMRVGKCWSTYEVESVDGSWVDLKIQLGEGDAVEPDEVFELLGRPRATGDPPTVTGFEILGRCNIVPHKVWTLSAICRMDRGSWPKTTEWRDFGHVHRIKQE